MSIIGKREITYNLSLYNAYKNIQTDPKSNQIKSNQIESNKIKTNKIESFVLLDHQNAIYEYLKSNKSILLFHKMVNYDLKDHNNLDIFSL